MHPTRDESAPLVPFASLRGGGSAWLVIVVLGALLRAAMVHAPVAMHTLASSELAQRSGHGPVHLELPDERFPAAAGTPDDAANSPEVIERLTVESAEGDQTSAARLGPAAGLRSRTPRSTAARPGAGGSIPSPWTADAGTPGIAVPAGAAFTAERAYGETAAAPVCGLPATIARPIKILW